MSQKTIKELVAEMAYRQVPMAELDAARDYERSLISDDLVIPQTGQIFVNAREIPVTVMITFSAPMTSGIETVLPAGTHLQIEELFEEKPIVITCSPVKYADLESLLVPEGDRRSSRYSGYYLSIQTLEFADGLELVSP